MGGEGTKGRVVMIAPPRVGRTTLDLRTHKWPVVTKGCLREKPSEAWNPLKRVLVQIYQAFVEVELSLAKARQEAQKADRGDVEDELEAILADMKRMRERIPLTIL